jgi:RNA-binding protein YlmH
MSFLEKEYLIGLNKAGGELLIKVSKKAFLEKFNNDDNGIISNLYDKIIISEKSGKNIVCDYFFTPNIWKTLLDFNDNLEANILHEGIFDDSERRMVAFSYDSVIDFPIKIICIINQSRFSCPVHKDYLGALMSLGIKREKMGDLICFDNKCIVPVCEDIHEYIMLNLKNVGKSPCNVEVYESKNFSLPQKLFDEVYINCASLRIDCVVSSICNISRSSACDLIKGKKVLVDYCEIDSKDKKAHEGSVITVRGYGKYSIKEETGFTRSGNIKLKVKKYI